MNANRKEIVCKMTRKRGGNRSRKIERNDVKLQMMKGEGGKMQLTIRNQYVK